MIAPIIFIKECTRTKICIDAMDVYYFEEADARSTTRIVFISPDNQEEIIARLPFDQVAKALVDARNRAATEPSDDGDRWKQDSEEF